jgi:hypothetical protein
MARLAGAQHHQVHLDARATAALLEAGRRALATYEPGGAP